MDPLSAFQIDSIINLVANLDSTPSNSRLDESSQLVSQNDILSVFRRWDCHRQRPACLEGRQPILDGIRAVCIYKEQEVAGDRECQILLHSLFADMGLILSEWEEERDLQDPLAPWRDKWMLTQEWRLPKRIQENQEWLWLPAEVIPSSNLLVDKLNKLVDKYEREKTVEERIKQHIEKENIGWDPWVQDEIEFIVLKQFILVQNGGPTLCDRRFSHDIPPDLPSTLFESDFCSSTVAILRAALLRFYKGYRLLNLQAA